jgi:hypothetical protein
MHWFCERFLGTVACLTANQQALDYASGKAKDVIDAMAKSGLLPALPQDPEECRRRVRSLLQLLAFRDNQAPLPDGVSISFIKGKESDLLTRWVQVEIQ